MSNNYYGIYYSNFCNNSKDLLRELTEHSLLQNFEKICVDNAQKLGFALPKFLIAVPTILVPDYHKPLTGVEAFKWIKWKLKQMNHENGLNAYEGNNFSNTFSNISKGSEKVENDQTISNNSNFTNLHSDNKIIYQSQEELKSYANSISNDVEKNFEQLMQDRSKLQNDTRNEANFSSPIQMSSTQAPPKLPPELQPMNTQQNNFN